MRASPGRVRQGTYTSAVSDMPIVKRFSRLVLSTLKWRLALLFALSIATTLTAGAGLVLLAAAMDVVRARIQSRGRSYEQQISAAYLEQLQERYLDHLRKTEGGRVLIVDLNDKDLLDDDRAYARFLHLITLERAPGHHVVRL